MRELTKTEKDICEKQLERFNKKIEELKDVINYAQRKYQFLQSQWDFEDFAKPLEREQTKKNTDNTIDQARKDMKELREKIADLTKQIKEGVETPSGTG